MYRSLYVDKKSSLAGTSSQGFTRVRAKADSTVRGSSNNKSAIGFMQRGASSIGGDENNKNLGPVIEKIQKTLKDLQTDFRIFKHGSRK